MAIETTDTNSAAGAGNGSSETTRCANGPQLNANPTVNRTLEAQPKAQSNVWRSRTATGHLKSALTNARNERVLSSQAPPRQSTANHSALASKFGQMNVQDPRTPNANVYNPSIGPSPSTMSMNWRTRNAAQSQASNGSFRQVVNNVVCKLSGFTRKDFRKGDITALPFHTANPNPNVDPNTDKHWVQTCEGPAYSKRRMMVVMWIHERDMFCLPLYTFNGSGLQNKPAHTKHEYVSMQNVGDQNFANQGMYPPVEVQSRRPMDPNTTVYITGGVKVACNEDIAHVGRMPRESRNDLLNLWRTLSGNAQREPWQD